MRTHPVMLSGGACRLDLMLSLASLNWLRRLHGLALSNVVPLDSKLTNAFVFNITKQRG